MYLYIEKSKIDVWSRNNELNDDVKHSFGMHTTTDIDELIC